VEAKERKHLRSHGEGGEYGGLQKRLEKGGGLALDSKKRIVVPPGILEVGGERFSTSKKGGKRKEIENREGKKK